MYFFYKFLQALDMLGNTKWRVNNKVLSVVDEIWASGGGLAGLVGCDDVRTISFLFESNFH